MTQRTEDSTSPMITVGTCLQASIESSWNFLANILHAILSKRAFPGEITVVTSAQKELKI